MVAVRLARELTCSCHTNHNIYNFYILLLITIILPVSPPMYPIYRHLLMLTGEIKFKVKKTVKMSKIFKA